MSTDRLDLLRAQFDLTWSLADFHLPRITTAMLLWEPASPCWTVRQDADGQWRPDWQIPEPDPIPPPTGAWITWHLGWWWTTALHHLTGRPADHVTWPGDSDAVVVWLRGLHAEWGTLLSTLDEAELNVPSGYPWPDDAGRTTADTLAWANVELMKNVAELGQLVLLHATRFT